MSLAKGFMQGWGLMDSHYRNKEQNEYRRSRDAIADSRYEAESSRRQDQHDQAMANLAQTSQLNQLKIDNYDTDKQQERAVRDAQIGASNARTERTNFLHEGEKKDREMKEALSAVTAIAETGDWEQFSTNEAIQKTDLRLLDDPELRQSLINVSNGFATGDLSAVAPDFNRAFKSQLNRMVGKAKGRDGGTIQDVEVVGIDPVEGGQFKFRVNVTTDKGRYQSYISELRTGDPKDPEKTFDAEQVVGKISAMAELGKIMESSGYNGMMKNRVSNYRNNMGLNPSSQNGNRVPAKIQEYEYIRGLLGEEGLQQMLFASKSRDPSAIRQTALTQATSLLKSNPRFMQMTQDQQTAEIHGLAGQMIQFMSQGAGGMGTGLPQQPTGNNAQFMQALQNMEALLSQAE